MLGTDSQEFLSYGQVIKCDLSSCLNYLEEKSKMPKEGNLYVRNDPDFLSLKEMKCLKEKVFGGYPIEAGYCNGYNSKLNCLEAHCCPEIDIAATDLVLLLAKPSDVKNGFINSEDVRAFFVPQGQGIVLYPYTLHFSPCKTKASGFKCGVILTDGTNADLDFKPSNPRLWKVNKWLYAHIESKQASLGAYVGIKGENIEVKC
jgi:hypothetical protein